KGKDPTEKREALRKAIATTKNFEGINGKWSFDANGDVDYDTMSGFKVVKADTPIGCKFQFETILEERHRRRRRDAPPLLPKPRPAPPPTATRIPTTRAVPLPTTTRRSKAVGGHGGGAA